MQEWVIINMDDQFEHYCNDVDNYSSDRFLQHGRGLGEKVLVVGESPAPNGWRRSGRAFYTPEGRLLPTGRNLNIALLPFDLTVEQCGFTELVKCFVGKRRSQLLSCGVKCWPIFVRQVEGQQFILLILLGVETLAIWNKINDTEIPIGALSHTFFAGREVKILSLYHPSPISPTGHKRNLEVIQRVTPELTSILMGK